MLLGEVEEAVGNTRCYIGEADVVAERLRYHEREKDFWDRVVVITSKDANLTKAHGRYPESRIIELVRAGRSCEGREGYRYAVARAARSRRLRHGLLRDATGDRLPVRRVNAIRVPSAKPARSDEVDDSLSPVFQLRNGKVGVDARAQQIDGEFAMLAGSTVVATWHGVGKAESTTKAYASYRAQHEHLVADRAIAFEAGRGRLPGTSPSATLDCRRRRLGPVV